MKSPKLTYVGPPTSTGERSSEPAVARLWRRLPKAFIVVVLIPMAITTFYFLFVASPLYVSEARFIVRATTQESPSSLGVALQGVGISSTQTDAFAVHEYIKSRNALENLSTRLDVRAMLARPGADFLTRYPRPWEARSDDGLHKGYNRFVSVGYDSTTGLSTLRVEGFRPDDAQKMANALLDDGENLVNRLNARANRGAVEEAMRNVAEAEARVTSAQVRLTAFRNRERLIDPSRTAVENSELIGGLLAEVAAMRAERAQVASGAPQSPLLPSIDSRIAAYERQIELERSKAAGNADSLAPKLETYESLSLDRQYADRALTSARTALDNAQAEERSQRLYLERVVTPNLPTDPSQPRRWLAILTALITLLIVYGTASLVWAGLKEHSQG